MKYCKECGAKNKNRAEECVSCGADSFEFHCEKCGTVFDGTLERCPNCRLKAGLRKKVCPECGREYFGEECPECGYSAESREERKGFSGAWIYIIIGVAVLLVIGLLALIILKPGKQTGFRLSSLGKKGEVSTYVAGEADHKDIVADDKVSKEACEEARKFYEDFYKFMEDYLSFIQEYTEGDNYKKLGDQLSELEEKRKEILDDEYLFYLEDREDVSPGDKDYCITLAERALAKMYEGQEKLEQFNSTIPQD